MKKIVISLLVLLIFNTCQVFANEEVFVEENSDGTINIIANDRSFQADLIAGYQILPAEKESILGNIIAIDDIKISETGGFEFLNVPLLFTKSIEKFKIFINVGEKNFIIEKYFVDVQGENISNIIQEIIDTSNENKSELLIAVAKISGADISTNSIYNVLNEKNKIAEFDTRLLGRLKEVETKSQYKKLFHECAALTLVQNGYGSEIKKCLTENYMILENPNFLLSLYNNLSVPQKDSLFDSISHMNFQNEKELLAAINLEIVNRQHFNSSNSGLGNTTSDNKQSISMPIEPNIEKPKPERYIDIEDAIWAKKAINHLSNLNIINGYEDNMFRPNNKITRAEFVKIVVDIAQMTDNIEGELSFVDTPFDEWYYNYLKIAFNNGIITGTGENFFPNDNITRKDIAVILNRVYKNKLSSINTNKIFADDKEIPEYAKESIYVLFNNQIINGYEDDTFKPNNYATRAEAANIIYKISK